MFHGGRKTALSRPLSPPLSHPPHVVTFFKHVPEFVHAKKESPVFLKSLIG